MNAEPEPVKDREPEPPPSWGQWLITGQGAPPGREPKQPQNRRRTKQPPSITRTGTTATEAIHDTDN